MRAVEAQNNEASKDTTTNEGGEPVINDVTPPVRPSNEAPDGQPVNTEAAGTPTPEAAETPVAEAAGEPGEGSGPVPASDATDEAAAAGPTGTQPVMQGAAAPAPPKKSKLTKSLLVVITILLLAIIGLAAYELLTHKSSNSSSNASTATVKKDIANLRYATTTAGWDKFYPGIDDSASYEEANRQIFEGLVRYDNRSQIVPLLATGWTNPDASTWVFNLKQGVKFHTGRDMTAADVKASFDAMQGTDLGDTFADTISSVTVTGPNQVTIKTATPDATLLNKLTNLYVFDTKSGKQNDPVNGTGAYTVKPGTTPGTNSLELVAFDQYHGGRPHVRSISFVGLSDNDHAKAYGDNKADVMSLTSDTPTAAGSRKYNQITLQPLGVQVMALNALKANSPLANLKVRQALEDTLSADAIAKAKGEGYLPASQLVPQTIPGYNPDVKQWSTNIAAAKQLLTDAGYPKGFTMKLTYFNSIQAEAAEIAHEAAQAGITITLDPQSDPSALGPIALGGKTDAFLVTQTSDILDSSDVLSFFDDTPNYSNQTVVDLVTKAQTTLDATKRLTYLQQANKLMADDVAAVPLFTPKDNNSVIYNPSYAVQRDIDNNNLGIYFWKVYAK